MTRGRNRREFLKGCCALGAAGVASQMTAPGHGDRSRSVERELQGARLRVSLRRQRCQQHDRADRLEIRRLPVDARLGGNRAGQSARRRRRAASDSILRWPTWSGSTGCSGSRRSSTSARWSGRRRATRLNNSLAAAQSLFTLGSDAAVAELRSQRRRHGMGRPHQRCHRRPEYGLAAAGHHGERRQRAVPVGADRPRA